MANPLIYDSSAPAPQTPTPQGSGNSNPLIYDSGSTPTVPEPSHPVTDELIEGAKNIGKVALHKGIEGVGALADLPGDVWDLAFHPEETEKEGMHPMAHLVAEKLADRLQTAVPSLKPNHPGAFTSTVGAGLGALPAAALAGPEAAVDALVPNFLGGAGGEAAKQAGAGPVGQTIAATAAALSPTAGAAAVRGAIRGSSGEATQAALDAADQAGITLSPGQATGSKILKAAEATSSSLPGGSPLAQTRGQGLNQQVENAVQAHADSLNPGAAGGNPLSPKTAGTQINEGISRSRETMAQEEDVAYKRVSDLVGEDTPMEAKNFAAKAKELAHPTGIPEVDSLLASPKMSQAEQAGQAASTPKATSPYNSDWNSFQSQPKPVPPLTFGNLRDMRSRLSSQIDWGMTPANPGHNAELKQLWGALTEDIKTGVRSANPDALKALTDANSLYAKNTVTRNRLDTIVEKLGGPEEVYNAAVNKVKSGDTKIDTVMSNLDENGRNAIRGTVLSRLGRPGGNGDFDANTFLTNWKNNLSSEAKDSLFGTGEMTGGLRQSLDSLADTVGKLKDQGYVKSGLSKAVNQGTHGIVPAALAILGENTLGAFAHHPALGVAAGAATGAGLAVNPVLSRVLMNPKTAAWLAQATKTPAGMQGVLLNQLDKMGNDDPDAKDLAGLIRQKQGSK